MNPPLPSFAPHRAIDAATAAAIRYAASILAADTPGVPLPDLLRLGLALAASDFAVDCESARVIGVPVIVLRDKGRPNPAPSFRLTRRERDVARLLAQGWRNQAIAAELKMAPSTAKDHIHNIMTRNGFASRTALAAALIRDGF